MLKTTFAAALATTLLLGPALAQERQGQFIAEQPISSLRLSKLKGVDVIGQDHTKLGDIDDVLLDRGGRVEAVVLAAGGLLGPGGRNVAIPFDQIMWNTGDVSRTTSPSASLSPENAAPAEQAATAAAERMPGANVSDRTLSAVQEGRSGAVDPSTGPVTTAATDRAPATVPVVSADGPVRAFVHLTKADIESASEFRYTGQRTNRDASSR
jgi:sporulation protein YlmC with PRC-barrel domain